MYGPRGRRWRRRCLSGERADLIEVLNLDEGAQSIREQIDGGLISSVRDRSASAGAALRTNDNKPHPNWCKACATCDFAAMGPTKPPLLSVANLG